MVPNANEDASCSEGVKGNVRNYYSLNCGHPSSKDRLSLIVRNRELIPELYKCELVFGGICCNVKCIKLCYSY